MKFAAIVILGAAIWYVAGDSAKTYFRKLISSPSANDDATVTQDSSDPNVIYWMAFWNLYPEGDGFGDRSAMEDLPIGGVTDSVLLDLHDVCMRYFDELEENHWKRDRGEDFLSDDLVRGHWARDFMPLVQRAREAYGTP